MQHVLRDGKAPSGIALIFVAKDGENSIAVSSGANARLTPADVRRARSVFNGAAVLIVQLESPLATVQAAVSIAVRHGLQVILNPAPARALPDSLLRQVSILTPNETEAELLTGVKVNSDAAAANRILAGPRFPVTRSPNAPAASAPTIPAAPDPTPAQMPARATER